MTVSQTRTATSAPAIPRSRSTEPDLVAIEATTPVLHEPPAATYPWPEPWRSARDARPRTEYWDVATASWHSPGPKT